MFKKMLAAAMMMVSYLGIKEIPIADGKVAFSDDQMERLKEGLTEETLLKAIAAFNEEIAQNNQVKSIEKEIQALLVEADASGAEAANTEKQKVPEENAAANDDKDAKANLALLSAKIKERDELIKALINDSEGDSPFAVIKGGKAKETMKHSATHLFASGKGYDAFEARPWNMKAGGLSTNATDYTEGTTIDKLNGDLELFFRENPEEITSLHRDNFGLPAHWPKRMNVVDRINDGSIATAEITQGRKLNWLPKNKQTIQAEEGKIFPVSIDIEFVGHILSSIEASWLSSFNKEGSQAYKMTFVRFLVQELDKKARAEDRVASIKGVYVKTPDSATTPGKFINRQNGLLYLAWKARNVDKKYRPFSVGTPTASNIVDYIDNTIKALPIEVRNTLGLELGLSPSWLKAYKRRSETLFAMNQDYKGYPESPKDYPNIKFVDVVDFEGSDFMYITFSDNIEVLENLPNEKSLYKFEMLKRIIYVFADYKLGIRIKHIGNKVKVGDPDEFKVQSFWSNDVPIFADDFFVPIYDDTTGEVEATFNQLRVDDAWATEIVKINGLVPGQIVRIQGNTALAGATNVKNNAALVIGSDFNLKLGGTLTMLVMADGTLKQLSRTTAPEAAASTVVTFDADPIDASLGSEFNYAGVAGLAITKILNGVEGQQVKITGKAGAGTDVTLSTVNNIVMASAATLAVAGDFVELVLVDGVWREFNRVIA
jgi:hypothetical protein